MRKPSFESFKPVNFKPSSQSFTSTDSDNTDDSDQPHTLNLGKTLSEEEQKKFMGNKVFSNVHNKNKFDRRASKDHGDKGKQWLHKNKKKNKKSSQQPQQV